MTGNETTAPAAALAGLSPRGTRGAKAPSAQAEQPEWATYPLDQHVNVHVAVARVRAEVGAIAKAKMVTQGPARFNFRGIDDVLNALHEPMYRHGVTLVPTKITVVESSERTTKSGGAQTHLLVRVQFRVYGPAGDSYPVSILAEGQDTSDKAASKAMSMAFKYAAIQTFVIPVAAGALDESDQDSTERVGQGPQLPGIEEIHARLRASAADLGLDLETATSRFREVSGNLTMDQFWALPADAVFAFVRTIAGHAERARAAAAAQAPVEAGGDSGGEA